jgi:hypothetical protein
MRPLLVLISFAGMIGLAAPAYADPADDAFLAELQAAGIGFPAPDRVIAAGRLVCQLSGQGKPMADVVNTIQGANPGLHGDNAARFTAIAAKVYCPQAIGQPSPTP